MNKGIGGHTKPYRGNTDSWITPKEVLKALGPFDLDPCAAPNQPWPCAAMSYNKTLNGLIQQWKGRVFCNPPYGPETEKWLEKMAVHSNGIALSFARTETRWFQRVFDTADGILFLAGRLTFHYEDGKKAGANSSGPSVLIGYGRDNCKCLDTCGLKGKYIGLTRAGDLTREDY